MFYTMGGARGTYREEEKCIRDLVGKSERTRILGILRCRWEGDIELYY
jgi:hypothetical protein